MVKISVIVPVFNCEDYIEESLGSVLNQTFSDMEIICVDDGSSDNSLDILNELASRDSRLRVFSQENQGSSVARNFALGKVRGEYVYFFDADDYLLEDGLEKAYSNAVSNDSDMVIFNFDLYEEDIFLKHSKIDIAQKFSGSDFNNFTFNYNDYRLLAFNGPFAPWFKLYKKEFLDKHDCFEFPVNLNHNDLPFHLMTISKASRISYVDEYLYHYRTDNPNSITNTRLRRYTDIFSILQIVEDFLKSEGLLDELKEEFDYLKSDQIAYQIRGRPDEYLFLAKEALSEVDLDNNSYIYPNLSFKVKSILSSNSIEEYNDQIELKKARDKSKRSSKNIGEAEDQNKSLKKDLKKGNEENKDKSNSNRSKITEALGNFKRLVKRNK